MMHLLTESTLALRPGGSLLPALLLVLAASGWPTVAGADSAADGGRAELQLRYRVEWVDQDGFSENALASTLRTRLNYRTGRRRNLSAMVEFDDVREVVFDDFNGGAGSTPERAGFPVVADPPDTRVNQAWVGFRPADSVLLRLGRQRIKLDNDRFVGNVGWRQNEQTYDAVAVETGSGDWRLFYAFVAQVNRIFGRDVPEGSHDHQTHLVNLGWDIASGQRLTTYFYAINNEDAAILSNHSYGLRYTGESTVLRFSELSYTAELARQRDAADNPADFTADYWRLDAALSVTGRFKPHLGWEVLGGSRHPGRAFRTPLATAHAFNGWADQFLATPDSGLKDLFAGFSGASGNLGWRLNGHRFSRQAGSGTLGWELDASLNVAINRHLGLLIKAAYFDASDAGFDNVTKFWVMLNADF